MQRLFSTFPNSWPGLGLIILRAAAGCSLATAPLVTGEVPAWVHLLERGLVDGIVLLLWIGLWTPLAAIGATAFQIGVIAVARRFDASLALAAALGLALAMLGPGAWSLDARLFGRKRIV